ncbi:MAG: adenylate/guanylate cyclase domain-containing protein [Actinobacteria bacterium]|nr:MAG: adenylate/guanylate cyclase domain-containing protein [Actinomycetota bacterium]
MPPETRYAKSGDVNIAYQVVGDGPTDLVYVPGWVSNVELIWEKPKPTRFLERLASFSRLILFDKRGTGMSDRVSNGRLPTLEERMDDVRAVLDAVGSKRAALVGHSEGGSMSLLFAATYPERARALVLIGVFARRIRTDDYPWAPSLEERLETIETVERDWGVGLDITEMAPHEDPALLEWYSTCLRRSASPGAAAALLRMNSQIDTRHVLPTIQIPTLVIHRTADRDVTVDEGRWIADQIPGARFVELPGDEHLVWAGDQDALLAQIEEFLTGTRSAQQYDRVLSTVLFTDIVGSTERARALGDRAWREVLDEHHTRVRNVLDQHRGLEVDTAGDGFFASFDGPARGIRAACAIRDGVRQLGLEIRAGLHTGECELLRDKIGGIAVHTGARVAAAAEPGEVLVSSTVKDLVAGSGIVFADRGERELKGLGSWRLYSVVEA